MIVCLCKGINEDKIKSLCPCSLKELREKTGLGTQCKKCLLTAHQVLKELTEQSN